MEEGCEGAGVGRVGGEGGGWGAGAEGYEGQVSRVSGVGSAKQRVRDLVAAEDGGLEEGEAPVAKRAKVDG